MFGFGKKEKAKQQRGGEKTADDRKIQQMMNEVAGELGIEKDARSAPVDPKELGSRVKEEVRKRT